MRFLRSLADFLSALAFYIICLTHMLPAWLLALTLHMCTFIHINFWCIHNLGQSYFSRIQIYFRDTHREKNILKSNSNALEKYEYRYLNGWYINWNKIFEKVKYLVTGKTPYFSIGPFCTPHSIFLNIGFWQSSFVWKCYVANLNTFN